MQRKINLVTTNPGKVASIRETLRHFDIDVEHYAHTLAEPRSDDLAIIAAAKAREAYNLIKKPCIAIDAGFRIQALDGYPGSYVNSMLKIGIHRLLRMMEGEPRECEFENCVAFFAGEGLETCFSAPIKGTLAHEPRGSIRPWSWSELDLIFIPEGEAKTLGEMTEEEQDNWRMKNGDSALIHFAKWYQAQ